MMLKVLFSISIALVIFLLLFGLIRKVILPQSNVHRRILAMERAALSSAGGENTVRHRLREIPFMERVVKPAGEQLVEAVSRLAPKQLQALLARRLVLAGKAEECTAAQFMVISLVGAVSMWLLLFVLLSDSQYLLIQQLVFMLFGGILGGLMPTVYLNILVEKRQAEIARQLPEVLDLLCVSVQAGLSFDAALRKITERMKGALISECRRMQEDIRMGMVRRTAMRNLADRCEVQDVALFMTSVIQAERLGTSMGRTLKNQADNIRERRRQFVQAEAMRAPVKIIFPLVIFIFPALFVVTLVPTLLFLVKNM